MTEVQDTQRREAKATRDATSPKRTKAAPASRKAEVKPSPWRSPLLIAGASALGAAALATALLVTRERRSRARNRQSEPSFWGALARSSALAAARSLTAYYLEKNLLPQLPNLAKAEALSAERSAR